MNGSGWQREVGGKEARASPSALRVSRLGDKKRRPVGAPLPALPLPPRPPLPAACSPAEPAPATARFGATAPPGTRLSAPGGEASAARSGISNRGRRSPRANRRSGAGTPKDLVQDSGFPEGSGLRPVETMMALGF